MTKSNKMSPMTPEFLVRDLPTSSEFYTELLPFAAEFQRLEDSFAAISLEGSSIMLEQTQRFCPVSDQVFGGYLFSNP